MADRRVLASWAADCAARVLHLFEAIAPDDDRPRMSIAHMGAHALGAAAYAAQAAGLAAPAHPDASSAEVSWQLAHLSDPARDALRRLPPIGENRAGPLGQGRLASGVLGEIIGELQAGLVRPGRVP